MELLRDIEKYWTNRAEGYSQVNQEELAGENRYHWIRDLEAQIPSGRNEELEILDFGTGPGFFSILLAEKGYHVTAVDYTEAMLEEARKNAGALAGNIQFYRMDAQSLGFLDESFDVIVTRNLTWNLENPIQAYREWKRVLKPGGVLLNYDANWYHHLFDEEKRRAYEEDRQKVSAASLEDHYTCTDIDARRVPLSRAMRPQWDQYVLNELGFSEVAVSMDVWEHVWSEVEKINYGSTPMFRIKGIR